MFSLRHCCLPQPVCAVHTSCLQAYGYYAGGSDDEWTLRENAAALRRYRLLPRVLVDVSAVDTSTVLLGEMGVCGEAGDG